MTGEFLSSSLGESCRYTTPLWGEERGREGGREGGRERERERERE